MHLHLNEEEIKSLTAYIDRGNDCEWLKKNEAVLDLYDREVPLTMNFVFVKGGIGIDGAAELDFCEEEDAYVIGKIIEDTQLLKDALKEAGAI